MFTPTLAERTLLSDLLLAGGLAMLAAWLLINLRKRRQNSTPPLTTVERVERVRQQRGLRGDLEELMVEIEQLAKRLGAQLDAKAIQLENLIQRAEDRIDQLNRATGVGDRNTPPGRGDAADDPPPPLLQSPRPPKHHSQPLETQDDDPLPRRVYALADQGLAPLEIAGQLNEHVGKIELILALRQG